MKNRDKHVDPTAIEAEENLLIDYQFLLQELMSAKGISRNELADAVGITKARLSQILGSEANPTVKTMARLIHALGEHPTIGVKDTKTVERSRLVVTEIGWGQLPCNDNQVLIWESDVTVLLESKVA